VTRRQARAAEGLDGSAPAWNAPAVLIFAILTAVMLGILFLGLALYTDFRGIATHYTARNRAVVETAVREGHDAEYFLFFGKNRKVGVLLMVLGGLGLLLAVLGLLGSLADGT
jgi:hypothetical protein